MMTAQVPYPQTKRFAEDRMDTHKNARLTPKGREAMVRAVVDGGLSKAAAARKFNTAPKTEPPRDFRRLQLLSCHVR